MSKKRVYTNTILGVLIFCIWSCSDANKNNEGQVEKVKIALRDAGNRMLLSQQDSISLILPILEIESKKFQLSFEKQLILEPGNLVAIIDESFQRANLPSDYRVEVIECLQEEVAYSYEMTANEETTIIPCSGRYLPKSCYTIELRFLNRSMTFSNSRMSVYALAFSAILIVVLLYSRKHAKLPEDKNDSHAAIGSFRFYPDQNKLVKEAVEIGLSRKECQILEIFVANVNQVVKRDELTKKVWEDNGVFVGRSLDTYISKLRKKLIEDDTIKLINVHGVGYKLEISP